MSNLQLPPVASITGKHHGEIGMELREVFSRCLTRTKGGAQLFISKAGETIVDLAGGSMSVDTPVQVFSVSKLIVAIASAHAHAHGVLDLDEPLANYWPAFNRAETKTITARMILDHSSGICGIEKVLSVNDWLTDALEEEVALQNPFWKPGTQHGYHAFTFGALMAGVFKHAVKLSIQDYVATHITGILNFDAGTGFWFGAPDEILPKLAKLSFDYPILTEAQAAALMNGQAIPDGSFAPILQAGPAFFTDTRVQQSNWPAVSGVSSARALGHIMNATLGYGVSKPLLSASALNEMILERHYGMDRALAHVSRYGSGVELPHSFNPYLGGRSFGHQGAGGSVVVADPDNAIVLAYTCTHSASTVGISDQAIALMSATNLLISP
ncbi:MULTISPECIES: serine hydrolase domain-containing protein [unclassified Acinetobacter]|uniref:serine hydrolase domain-containing protein n=1 Tax=unclassified Acinetobacter TaxID=196816 RepID=UPI0029349F05|nr:MULTISPECIES: serine hydrolase domain-containing protein [unclassified Acinetobacter]WOE32516.1 serine hydrolase domain-containing protein [Acinetobacter sp. SAAs470]WOE37992.1 serine hydrolase domain-containing protein [Acinetobacter sp. SAAs474]